ncbi:hypothetical protein D9M69_481630 [compost metagenome]
MHAVEHVSHALQLLVDALDGVVNQARGTLHVDSHRLDAVSRRFGCVTQLRNRSLQPLGEEVLRELDFIQTGHQAIHKGHNRLIDPLGGTLGHRFVFANDAGHPHRCGAHVLHEPQHHLLVVLGHCLEKLGGFGVLCLGHGHDLLFNGHYRFIRRTHYVRTEIHDPIQGFL